MLNLSAIAQTPIINEPFPHFVTRGVLDADALRAIGPDFPPIDQPGVFTLADLTYGAQFARLIDEINARDLEEIMEDKFRMDLSDKPLMITIRGHCHPRDGRIHTDSKDKLVTCLLYLNDENWNQQGGRLRFLRDGKDINSAIAEVPPNGGNLVAFKRTDNSWHGHEPFDGPRRYVMFNWIRSDVALAKNLGRHRLSAMLKKVGLAGNGSY